MVALLTDTKAIERVLFGLADPLRRHILDTLASTGAGTATTLAAGLPGSRQAVVKHPAILHRAGLGGGRRLGGGRGRPAHPRGRGAAAPRLMGLAAPGG